MTLATNLEAACSACRKPILNRRSTLQTKCAPCVYKAANARDKELRKAQRQASITARKAHAADKRETKARREAIKTRSDWLNEAQVAVNAYVRARDKGLPCISCGCAWAENFQAGHFLSRGAHPELRFDTDNINGQCVRDNMHLSGHLLGYRKGLIERKGIAVVEALEGPHPLMHYSVDDLKAIKETYRAKTRELKGAE